MIADHNLISVNLNISKPKRRSITKTFCQEKFSSKLVQNSPDIHQILLTDNVNEQVRTFNEVFIKNLD